MKSKKKGEKKMSKSIYDEALDILVNSFQDPQDEDNDCFMFNFRQIIKIEKAILIAQDQEKLLGLYKKLNELRKELITLARYNSWSWDLDSEIIDIEKQIKELEK